MKNRGSTKEGEFTEISQPLLKDMDSDKKDKSHNQKIRGVRGVSPSLNSSDTKTDSTGESLNTKAGSSETNAGPSETTAGPSETTAGPSETTAGPIETTAGSGNTEG